MACSEYLWTAKVWANQLATVGRPIDDEDLISYIISGLSPIFNSFITSYTFITRENPLNFEDFRDELLNHEMLLNQQMLLLLTHLLLPCLLKEQVHSHLINSICRESCHSNSTIDFPLGARILGSTPMAFQKIAFLPTDRDPTCHSTSTISRVPTSTLAKAPTMLLPLSATLQNPTSASPQELHSRFVAKPTTKL